MSTTEELGAVGGAAAATLDHSYHQSIDTEGSAVEHNLQGTSGI